MRHQVVGGRALGFLGGGGGLSPRAWGQGSYAAGSWHSGLAAHPSSFSPALLPPLLLPLLQTLAHSPLGTESATNCLRIQGLPPTRSTPWRHSRPVLSLRSALSLPPDWDPMARPGLTSQHPRVAQAQAGVSLIPCDPWTVSE